MVISGRPSDNVPNTTFTETAVPLRRTGPVPDEVGLTEKTQSPNKCSTLRTDHPEVSSKNGRPWTPFPTPTVSGFGQEQVLLPKFGPRG